MADVGDTVLVYERAYHRIPGGAIGVVVDVTPSGDGRTMLDVKVDATEMRDGIDAPLVQGVYDYDVVGIQEVDDG